MMIGIHKYWFTKYLVHSDQYKELTDKVHDTRKRLAVAKLDIIQHFKGIKLGPDQYFHKSCIKVYDDYGITIKCVGLQNTTNTHLCRSMLCPCLSKYQEWVFTTQELYWAKKARRDYVRNLLWRARYK